MTPLELGMRAAGLPAPEREHRFHPTRRWRFDYAWPKPKVALEYEGTGGAKSRHMTFTGYANDCEKYNEAAILGWRVIRVTVGMVKDGRAIDQITRALKRR